MHIYDRAAISAIYGIQDLYLWISIYAIYGSLADVIVGDVTHRGRGARDAARLRAW